MNGTYRMVRMNDSTEFDVIIPEMLLYYPHGAN